MSPLIDGLAPGGRMIVVGAAGDPITVNTISLVFGTTAIAGSLTGSSIETKTTSTSRATTASDR